jgi:hypothetical protein
LIGNKLRRLSRVADRVLHRIVVDAVPISAIHALSPVFCQSVDLPGRRERRIRRCWTTRILAFYWYAELPEPGSDCGLPFHKGAPRGHARAVLRRRERPDVFDAAAGVPRFYLGIYFGPGGLRLWGCHVLRVHRQRWWRIIFEASAVNGADLATGRRGLRESRSDPSHGGSDPSRNLGVHADQLRCALTNIPGERLRGGLPSNPLCG